MKCLRLKCNRRATRQGLCHRHYELIPRGYVPADQARKHVTLLRARGYGLRELSNITGLSLPSLLLQYDRIQLATAKAIMAIPIPPTIIDCGGLIPSTGTIRRLQALVAFGYSQRAIAQEMGVYPKHLTILMQSERVLASTAVKTAEVFNRLQMTPGTDNWSRSRAQRKGWAGPWLWDENTIDDPAAKPMTAQRRQVFFEEKYHELRDMGLTREAISKRLGVKQDSLERQLDRYKLRNTA